MVPPLSGPPGLLVAATDGPPDKLDWENLVYPQPNTESMVNHISLFKPRSLKLY